VFICLEDLGTRKEESEGIDQATHGVECEADGECVLDLLARSTGS
jgi:hypothetical protein